MMQGRLIFGFLLVTMFGLLCRWAFTFQGTTDAGLTLGGLLDGATKLAGSLGAQSSGEFPRGDGCKINWSYQGMMMGFEWKYMGICTDSCTKETETVFYYSKGGTVEHCLQNLLRKVARHEDL